MPNLVDWILELFRDQQLAQDFVTNPGPTMASAGLSTVSSAQLASVAAATVPGLALGSGGGDAVLGLQQAVSNHFGFAPAMPSFSPFAGPLADLAGGHSAEFASNNSIDTELFSTHAGGDVQQGGLNFGLGDIALGHKTSATGDGAVAIGGSNQGDILSGDGAVLGDANTVTNGNTTWGGELPGLYDGTVIQTSGHGSTALSAANTGAVDASTRVESTATTDNSVLDSSVHSSSAVDGSGSGSLIDVSSHSSSGFESSVGNGSGFESSAHSSSGFESSLGNGSMGGSTHQDMGFDFDAF
jgi:Head domain of trimeric autotransporter adhesin